MKILTSNMSKLTPRLPLQPTYELGSRCYIVLAAKLAAILDCDIVRLLSLRVIKPLTLTISKLAPHLPLYLPYDLRYKSLCVLAAIFSAILDYDILTLFSLRVIKTLTSIISKLTPYLSL